MFRLALLVMLQATAPAMAQDAPATGPSAPAAEAQAERPATVCTMEPVTGTRARKQKVCRTPGYEKGSERSKDMLRQIQGGSGNVPPTLPKGIGG